ncbi:DUF2235 domain-containing protein [Meridianimarinicoccus sp. MJW13]|uniref:DUF2235 domain-containing protein n=1 Tax=Meridianimarinicoccus sp. MJW13 TaxID=2720031 RepID=UPI00299F8982|nr:DUF2235 domain-containing protein [Fluviibacterium sp. MJW13]
MTGRASRYITTQRRAGDAPRTHVVILDGTLSSLDAGRSTNAGRIFKLLMDLPAADRPSVYYEEGIQWRQWRSCTDVMTGRGINRQIRRAYGFLASRYQPGDRIFLFGYSRGAFAVRSLAGVIDRVGLLKPHRATERMIRQLYRHYETDPHGRHARLFAEKFCRPGVEIEMVGVFDTVKALGWRFPILAELTDKAHDFHSTHLGHTIRHGFHALALHETREAFEPQLWTCPKGWTGHVEQVWFRGTHGDIGGQLSGFDAARPLANIPLVWMLEKAEACGLTLPTDWRARYPMDPQAPSCGWRGWSRIFPLRKRRVVGRDPSESLHPTARNTRKVPGAEDLPLAQAG